MQPHQQRVVDERAELVTKLEALIKFQQGEIFKTLPRDEQARLNWQGMLMSEYAKVLAERIAHFS